MPRLLLIEDDRDSLDMLSMLLETFGFEVQGMSTSGLARTELRRDSFDLVLADLMVDSHDLVRSWADVDQVVRLARPAPVGLLTACKVSPAEVTAHRLAFVLLKPCPTDHLLSQLAATLEVRPLAPEQDATIRAYFRALEQGDWDALMGCCTQDVIYHLPSDDRRFGRTIAGRGLFREFASTTFRGFEDARFVVDELRALPRGAVVRYTGSWRGPNGARQVLPGSLLMMLDGNRIAEIGVRIDVGRLNTLLAS